MALCDSQQLDCIQQKFEFYFSITSISTRAIWRAEKYFEYPVQSVLPDICILTSLFAETWEQHKNDMVTFHSLFRSAFAHLTPMVEAFWNESDGFTAHNENYLKPDDYSNMETLGKILRNGFQHFHYHFANLSSEDYFKVLPIPPGVLQKLPSTITKEKLSKDNYLCYIVDYSPNNYQNIRVIRTRYGKLRYHLYLFFSAIFAIRKGQKYCTDCFGNTEILQ
jgi:hypothetical protein